MTRASLAAATRGRLSGRWAGLSARERRLLRLAGLAVALGTVIAAADWLAREHGRLTRELAATLPRHAAVARLSADLAALGKADQRHGTAPTLADRQALLAHLRRSSASSGLKLEFRTGDDGRLAFAGMAGMDALLPWLAERHALDGLALHGLEWRADDGAQTVRGWLAEPAMPGGGS